jgi:hypothetical protein
MTVIFAASVENPAGQETQHHYPLRHPRVATRSWTLAICRQSPHVQTRPLCDQYSQVSSIRSQHRQVTTMLATRPFSSITSIFGASPRAAAGPPDSVRANSSKSRWKPPEEAEVELPSWLDATVVRLARNGCSAMF